MVGPAVGSDILLPGRAVRTAPIDTLDPRVGLIGVAMTDVVLLSVGSELMEYTATGIALLCLLASLRPVKAVIVLLIQAAMVAVGHILLPTLDGPAAETVSLLMFAVGFTYRLALVGVIAWAVTRGITTGALQATLAWARVPRIVAVPAMVAVRFFPVVVDDVRTIRDNLILRGVVSSSVAVFIHPVMALRHGVLPLIASSLRTGDELAASALLRGLGAQRQPTSVVQLHLKAIDVVAITIVVLVVALGVLEQLG